MERPFQLISHINDKKDFWKLVVKVKDKWTVVKDGKEHLELVTVGGAFSELIYRIRILPEFNRHHSHHSTGITLFHFCRNPKQQPHRRCFSSERKRFHTQRVKRREKLKEK
ncbi:hypothetical protein MtrunA17_Chr6g0464321 [Medicago truncatula]|uniref:Uncharacterized protein n=1 Tax=Medicago truncatula TaxID=3880 RepID=A0A072U8B3_MEDTR|nr:hypothetical protein MTR_6g037120 [Medicago truncatula]RHN51061.1 hypothetical protein MtrunA17_Chr6g0464321 [Medicago truncatula]